MNQRHGFVLLLMFAAFAVSGALASPVHPSRHQRFVPYGDFSYSSPLSTDEWLGGTGDWSDAGLWSGGLPAPQNDVIIDSGGNDLVYLDMSADIASLTLGDNNCPGCGYISKLTGNGTPQTLNISGALTVNQSGVLDLRNLTAKVGAGFVNSGLIDLFYSGSLLSVTGNSTNSGVISVQEGNITIDGALNNSGQITMFYKGTVAVTGDVENDGSILFTRNYAGQGHLVVGGTLTNYDLLDLYAGQVDVGQDMYNRGTIKFGGEEGAGGVLKVNGTLNNDLAQIDLFGSKNAHSSIDAGTLVNGWDGTINIREALLNVSGDTTNSGVITLTSSGLGAIFTVGGTLTNDVHGKLTASNTHNEIDAGALENSGLIDLEGDSNGNGSNKLRVAGTLINNGSGTLVLNGSYDEVDAAALVNRGTIKLNSQPLYGGNSGTILAISGNADNLGLIDIARHSTGDTLTIGGNLTNEGTINEMGLSQTFKVGGDVNNSGTIALGNWPSDGTMTIGGSLNNSGLFDMNIFWNLQVSHDVNNYGSIFTGDKDSSDSGNHITINGMLTNYPGAQISLHGYGDWITAGMLVNMGSIDLLSTQSINVLGDASNSGTISLYANMNGGGRLQVGGTLTNDTEGKLILYGPHAAVTAGTLDNSGLIDLESTANHVTVNGTLTNNASGTLLLNGQYNEVDAATLVNRGAINVKYGATLQVSGDALNYGDISLGSFTYSPAWSTLQVNGDLDNSGSIDVFGFSGSGYMSVAGSLSNSGKLKVWEDAIAAVGHDANNSGTIFILGTADGGGSLTIKGTLTNDGQIAMTSAVKLGYLGVGTLVNDNLINLAGGRIEVSGYATNSGLISLQSANAWSDFIVHGVLTNNQGGQFLMSGWGEGNTATLGGLMNAGTVELENGARLQVAGDAYNFAGLVAGVQPGSANNMLSVTGALINSGNFVLGAYEVGSGSATVGSLINSGGVTLDNFSTLLVNGNLNNSKNVTMGYGAQLQVGGDATNSGSFTIYDHNQVTIAGVLNNSGSIEMKGRSDTVSAGSLINPGSISLQDDSDALQINGDANNSGTITLNQVAQKLNITGTLSNSGNLRLNALQDHAEIGSVVNSGTIDLEYGSTLLVSGDAYNFGTMGIGYSNSANNMLTVNGTLANASTGAITVGSPGFQYGPANFLTAVGLNNGGTISILNGSSLQVQGDAANSGTLYMGSPGCDTCNGNVKLTVGGTLTNTGTVELISPFSPGGPDSVELGAWKNSGTFTDGYGSFITVHGDVGNSGKIYLHPQLAGTRLEIGGNLNNSGSLDLAVYSSRPIDVTVGVGTGLTNSGTIDLHGGTILNVSGSVNNSGTIASGGSVRNTLFVGGKFTNNAPGVFSLNGSSDIANVATFANSGAVTIGTGDTLNVTGGPHATPTAVGAFLNNGSVTISQGGILASPTGYTQTGGQTTIDGALKTSSLGIANFAGGSVYGNQGTVTGNVLSNAAINVGDHPLTIGLLTFMGNFTQGPRGSMTFDIGGTAHGQYDQLIVNGRAQLDGTLYVDLINGFVPIIGNEFDIMHFTSMSGVFSGIFGLQINDQEHFVLEYNSTDLTLDVVAGALSAGLLSTTGPKKSDAESNSTYVISFVSATAQTGDESLITSSDSWVDSGNSNVALNQSNGRNDPGSTPEPGTFLLFGSGLLCLGYGLRRRMTR